MSSIYTNRHKIPDYPYPNLLRYAEKPISKGESIYLNGLNLTFRNAEDTAIIDIDGGIGFDFIKWLEDEEQNTQENIKKKLREIDASEIIVNINSLGGIVNDGLVIHDYLQEHPANVTTVTRGMTASAGTLIMQAGHRKISANSRVLVHKAVAGLFGWFNSNDLDLVGDDLGGLNETISNLYAASGNRSAEEYLELMSQADGRGKWISAQEALEWGLVDEVYEPSDKQESNGITANQLKAAGMPVPDDMKDNGWDNAPIITDKELAEQNKEIKKHGGLTNYIKHLNKKHDSTESEAVPEGISLEEARNREIELLTNEV